jgi:hypothetical protein
MAPNVRFGKKMLITRPQKNAFNDTINNALKQQRNFTTMNAVTSTFLTLQGSLSVERLPYSHYDFPAGVTGSAVNLRQ